MAKTVSEKLDEVLGLEACDDEVTDVVPAVSTEVVPSGNPEKDMQDDFDRVRTAVHSLIDKGTELVDHANFFAKEKQDARSVEAAAVAQKEARENILALVTLHKSKKEIERMSGGAPTGIGDNNKITQNAVFIGTTGDLMKFAKDMNVDGTLQKALDAIDVTPEKTN